MAGIFARIANGEIPSYKIAETENCFAFLDLKPLAKGHTLIIPKQEIDYILICHLSYILSYIPSLRPLRKQFSRQFLVKRLVWQ